MNASAHAPKPDGVKRRRLPIVTVERPRCPACGGVKLRKYRTLADQGDGSALWWVQCLNESCGPASESCSSDFAEWTGKDGHPSVRDCASARRLEPLAVSSSIPFGLSIGKARREPHTWSALGSGMDGNLFGLTVFDDGNGPGPVRWR